MKLEDKALLKKIAKYEIERIKTEAYLKELSRQIENMRNSFLEVPESADVKAPTSSLAALSNIEPVVMQAAQNFKGRTLALSQFIKYLKRKVDRNTDYTERMIKAFSENSGGKFQVIRTDIFETLNADGNFSPNSNKSGKRLSSIRISE